jgi:hypothetical protein
VESTSLGGAFEVVDVTGVEIAGFRIDGFDDGVVVSASAAPVGLDLHHNTVADAGDRGILISQSSGDSTVRLADNTVAGLGGGIAVSVAAGTLEVAVERNTGVTSTAGNGIVLNAALADALYVTSFCGNDVSGDTAGAGITSTRAVFDAEPADADFTGDEVACATGNSVGSIADPVGGSGVVLDLVEGDLDLGQLDVFAGTPGGGDETGLRVIATDTFSAAAGSGFQLTTSSGTVSSIDGPAIDIDPTDLEAMVLTSVVSQNSDTVGFGLTEVSGSFQVTGPTAIGSAGTDGIAVTDSSVAMTFTGPLAIATAGDRGIELDALTGNLSILDPTSSITGTTGDAFRSVDGRGAIDFNGSITNASGHSVDLRTHGGGTVVDFDGLITDSGLGIELFDND